MADLGSLMFSSEEEEVQDEPAPDELFIDYDVHPLDRFIKFHKGTLIFHRIFALKDLKENVSQVGFNSLVNKIIPLLSEVTDDNEPSVKITCMEILPHISTFLIQSGKKEVIEKIIPLCFKLLSDKNVQTQMAAHESFVNICGMLTKEEIESSIVPTLNKLIDDRSEEDNRVEGLMLLKDMIPLMGKESAFGLALSKASISIIDSSFRVRKANVEVLAELAKIFTPEQSRLNLLPKFLVLCEDKIWGVRKACAISLKIMSKSVSEQERAGPIAEVARSYLSDSSRWVKIAMNESLGELISTYTNDPKVPDFLIQGYLSMANGDQDSVFSCAFNFPAVALALKKENWHLIRNLYTKLASEVQWNVRRTLAFSTHEVAKIIGSQKAAEDLVPSFDLLLRDLDEVRIGALTNYAKFVSCLGAEMRLIYLIKITELISDTKNSTFKEIIARQIGELSEFYTAGCIYENLVPLCLNLATDPVAKVRETTIPSLCHIYSKFSNEEDLNMRKSLTNEIIKLSSSSKHTHRQLYAQTCKLLVNKIGEKVFEEEFLMPLVSLCKDPVPNVRYSTALSISVIFQIAHFRKVKSLGESVEKLKKDKIKCVKEVALNLK